MAYDPDAVMHRDKNACRLRYRVCSHDATHVVLEVPEYLGGPNSDDNARAACQPCATQHQQQRHRAAKLFNRF